MKIHSSCEIDFFVETHLCKLRVILYYIDMHPVFLLRFFCLFPFFFILGCMGNREGCLRVMNRSVGQIRSFFPRTLADRVGFGSEGVRNLPGWVESGRAGSAFFESHGSGRFKSHGLGRFKYHGLGRFKTHGLGRVESGRFRNVLSLTGRVGSNLTGRVGSKTHGSGRVGSGRVGSSSWPDRNREK